MAKRTPQKVLDAIDAWDDGDADAQIDAHIDAEMERVLAMTPEQVEADLRAAGVDVEAEDAKARAAYEKAQRGEAPTESSAKGSAEPVATNGNGSGKGKGTPAGVVVPISKARNRWRWGGGFLIAATIGGGYVATMGSSVMTSPKQYAEQQRQFAADACKYSRWSECLQALDKADKADPEGANDPREIELRKAAQAGIGSSGEGKPR
jgi:hypothetical protein